MFLKVLTTPNTSVKPTGNIVLLYKITRFLSYIRAVIIWHTKAKRVKIIFLSSLAVLAADFFLKCSSLLMYAIEYILGNKQIYQRISRATHPAEKQEITFLCLLQISSF